MYQDSVNLCKTYIYHYFSWVTVIKFEYTGLKVSYVATVKVSLEILSDQDELDYLTEVDIYQIQKQI